MRVAVCEILGEVLVRILSGDRLEDSARADRDRFLDTLQEHMHDTHSNVRTRVIQVYTRIVNSKVGGHSGCVCVVGYLQLWMLRVYGISSHSFMFVIFSRSKPL